MTPAKVRPLNTLLPIGAYAALVTPLLDDGSLDERGLRNVVRHVLGSGCVGVVALGSSGEVASLTRDIRRRVVAAVVDEAGADGVVVAGAAQCAVADALAEIQEVATAGATAALVAPPFYAPLDATAVERFYRLVGNDSPIPVLAYHIPAFTKQRIEPAIFGQLATDGVIAGLKDSNRDLEYLQQVLAAAPADVQVFTGTDSLIAAASALGAAGSITVGANVAPAWAAELFELARSGSPAVPRLQQRLSSLLFAIRVGSFPAGVKAALAALGLCGPATAPPIAPLGTAEVDALAARLAELGAELATTVAMSETRTGE